MVTSAWSGIGRPAGIPAAQTASFGLRPALRPPGPGPPHDQPDSDRPNPTRLGSRAPCPRRPAPARPTWGAPLGLSALTPGARFVITGRLGTTLPNQNYLGLVGPPIGHKQKPSAKVCTKRSGSSFLGGDMGSCAGDELMNCCSPFFRGRELVAARQPLLALSPGCINHYGVPDVVMGMARVADELATARPGPDGRRGAERQPLGTHAGGAPRTL